MNRPKATIRRIQAFTLVEIMIVVVIIGLLAAMAIPAFQRSRLRSQAARLTNDFRQIDSAFQRYLLENGTAPAAAGLGVVPTGMTGYLPTAFTSTSPLGGNYQWSGPSAYVVLRNSNATDTIMQMVDTALDDGDLTTGEFQKLAGIGYGMHIR
ncbi:MAG: prepilin-type N-terminal cleavage/methylation domain-containing protein [Lacunisphaera sp.]|nr:prepilin-type N-terminal cleavage/methylation domain-containing protein [Lacunisphaera sp.]